MLKEIPLAFLDDSEIRVDSSGLMMSSSGSVSKVTKKKKKRLHVHPVRNAFGKFSLRKCVFMKPQFHKYSICPTVRQSRAKLALRLVYVLM